MISKVNSPIGCWLMVLLYCVFIFIQSSFPSPIKRPAIPNFDKFLHLTGYALLGALFFRAFASSFQAKLSSLMIISILSSTLYGIGDEFHQSFVSSRTADIMDVLADMAGSIIGVFAYYMTASFLNAFFRKKIPD